MVLVAERCRQRRSDRIKRLLLVVVIHRSSSASIISCIRIKHETDVVFFNWVLMPRFLLAWSLIVQFGDFVAGRIKSRSFLRSTRRGWHFLNFLPGFGRHRWGGLFRIELLRFPEILETRFQVFEIFLTDYVDVVRVGVTIREIVFIIIIPQFVFVLIQSIIDLLPQIPLLFLLRNTDPCSVVAIHLDGSRSLS